LVLPLLIELWEIVINRSVIYYIALENEGQVFINAFYWSLTEHNLYNV